MADFVVWNPWAAGAAKMGDMDDEEWKFFICVEAAQASKVVHVKASGEKDKIWKASHILTLTEGIYLINSIFIIYIFRNPINTNRFNDKFTKFIAYFKGSKL